MDGDATQEKQNLSSGVDTVDAPPNNYIYRKIDVAFVVCGIFTFLLDWVSWRENRSKLLFWKEGEGKKGEKIPLEHLENCLRSKDYLNLNWSLDIKEM